MSNYSVFMKLAPEDLLDKLGCCSVPIDLDQICAALEIEVERALNWDDEHSGSIRMAGDKVICWINPLDSTFRQRFTLAHEIGHYIHDFAPVLATGGVPDTFLDASKTLKRDGRQDPREYRANDFAARLLMPRALLYPEVVSFVESERKRTQQKKVAREAVFSKMAERFQVSKSAMEIRLINLGIVRRVV